MSGSIINPGSRPANTPSFRVRGRSFMALILTPEPPLGDWLEALDRQIERSPVFFADRPIIINLGAMAGEIASFPALLAELELRELCIIGVEGLDAEPSIAPPGGEGWGRTPLLALGRSDRTVELPDPQVPAPAVPPAKSLIIDAPVRSGQSVVFEEGDVTIIGSVASGAEIIAGGSIHVYGRLRGRAIAGLASGATARIFCRKLEAELMAIDGLYITAEEWGEALRGQAVQVWRDGDTVRVTALE